MRKPVTLCVFKDKIHYTSFPAASPQQVGDFPITSYPKIHYTSHQFHNKSVTSWRGQKSAVSVVSCRFPNSTTTNCCGLVAYLLVTSWHVKIVCRVANKSTTRWQLPRLRAHDWCRGLKIVPTCSSRTDRWKLPWIWCVFVETKCTCSM